MKSTRFRLIRRLIRNESGQSIAVFIVILFGLMALAASGVETGHVYYAYRLLQASTRTATLAAAQAMPDLGSGASSGAGTAWGNLVQYSSESGDKNANGMLQNDSITANFYCATSMEAAPYNVGCETPPSGEGSCTSGTTCNAVKVTQTASVHLWFGGFVGLRTMSLTATASASMRGGSDSPFNIAVILDTTESMTATANAKDGCSGATQIQCAVTGLSDMLQNMYPCPLNESCPGNKSYVDDVALFVFPAVKAGNTNDDTQCPTKNPPIVPYSFVNVTPGTTQNLMLPQTGTDAGTYEVQAFDNSYRANDNATTLYSGDGLAAAVGVGSGNCKGLQAPGGEGTYYAQVIYEAQAALLAAQSNNPNSINVMIILSDGDAGACAPNANTSAGGCTGTQLVAQAGTLNGTGTSKTNAAGYELPTYPSALGECGQAVQAAQLATQAGTRVYTIAMGAETSGGCTTDKTYTITSGSTYGAEAWPSGAHARQPCNAIGAMASDTTKFFSDNTGGCAATGGNANYTTIGGIFQAIGNTFTSSRLIPVGTT